MFGKVIKDEELLCLFSRGYLNSFVGKPVVSTVPLTIDSLLESDKVIGFFRQGVLKAGFVYNRRPRRYLLTLDEKGQIDVFEKELFIDGAVETCAMWKAKDFRFFTLFVWTRIFFEILKTPGKYTIAGIYPAHKMFDYYTRHGAVLIDKGEDYKKVAIFIIPKLDFIKSYFYGVRRRGYIYLSQKLFFIKKK
jgi:hypothetical protein